MLLCTLVHRLRVPLFGGVAAALVLVGTGSAAASGGNALDSSAALTATGFWSLTGNAGTTPGTNFLGTTDDTALELKVNAQRVLRLEPSATSPNLIGGVSGNKVQASAYGAMIGGGGNLVFPGDVNLVNDNYGVVGGGVGNRAGDGNSDPTTAASATVSGGRRNVAAGGFSAVGGGYTNAANGGFSTVGGGHTNTASALNSTVGGGIDNRTNGPGGATIGGGVLNLASNYYSTVAGGHDNTANGYASTVPGGGGNRASGAWSFAAGTTAWAASDGAFVWGDHHFATLVSPAANTFTVRASAGMWLGTNSSPSIPAGRFINTSTGAYLSSAGVWTDASDRALKHDFRSVNKQSVLDRVARMPITSWSYRAEKPSVRHIGPTAQDFYKAFGLGLDDRHIGTIDEGGVALAAIQGLYRQNKALERENRTLRAQLSAQNARLTKLEDAFSKLSR
jgi:trimeric autotransporter adhesin